MLLLLGLVAHAAALSAPYGPQCKHCGAGFGSRNLLFKHLRSSDACAAAIAAEDGEAAASRLAAAAPTRAIALLIGYTRDGAAAEAAVAGALARACGGAARGRVESVTRAGAARARSSACLLYTSPSPRDRG